MTRGETVEVVMKQLAIFAFAVSLLGAGDPLATSRQVHGVITSVEPATVTIASAQHTVTGKIDAALTKVTLHGKPAKLADLQVTAHAKAELCLDDVWVSIDAH